MCDEFIINKIQWMLFYFIHIIIIIIIIIIIRL